jgi:hypothetical protein
VEGLKEALRWEDPTVTEILGPPKVRHLAREV